MHSLLLRTYSSAWNPALLHPLSAAYLSSYSHCKLGQDTSALSCFPRTLCWPWKLRLIGLEDRRGGKNKQRGRRNAIYFPPSPFINLHLLSSKSQENHSFTKTGMLISQVQNLWKITVEKSFTTDLWGNGKKWKCWTNCLLCKYPSISNSL